MTDSFMSFGHKVHICIEYHSVCPLVRIGTSPPPLPQASVSPLESKRVGDTLTCRCGGGGGTDSDDWRKILALCLLFCFDIQASGSVTYVWKVYFLYIFFLHTSTLFQRGWTLTICVVFSFRIMGCQQ